MLRVFLRTVFGWQRRRAARRGLVGARGGSVTAIQRFGGAANLNVHFHALVFDGVYTRATPTTRPLFHRLPAPTDADLAALLTRLHRRVRRLLARRGRWPDCCATCKNAEIRTGLTRRARWVGGLGLWAGNSASRGAELPLRHFSRPLGSCGGRSGQGRHGIMQQ